MKKNIEKAMDDIAVIKSVIERTQTDFSKIAPFFICIGIINLLQIFAEQLAYYFRNVNGYHSEIYTFLVRTCQLLPLIAYILCFLFFCRRIKAKNNTISKGILRAWGIVLIGSEILEFLYMFLIPVGNSSAVNMLWRCKELVVILPIIIILFVTGILTQRSIITIVTGVYSAVYFVLFTGMKEIRYGTLGGPGTRVSVSSISIRIVMTLGMILLGLFLQKGAAKYGNTFNTGSFPDET